MPKTDIKAKKGFTIIEVILVLAIGSLIILMALVALPSLQASQRDTQRKNDYAMLETAITNYASNNRGKLPDAKTLSRIEISHFSAATKEPIWGMIKQRAADRQ